MVHICVVTFNRQDLLRKMLLSLRSSTVMPDGVWIIDHGYDAQKITDATRDTVDVPLHVITLEDPGNAVAANWFMKNVPPERIGIGDDVQFESNTIEQILLTPGDVVFTQRGNGGFPCALIRDSCIEKVGYFDETISPQYLYYEDWDYTRRMSLNGVTIGYADCSYIHDHGGSQTISKYTPKQMAEHHRKFLIAKANYIKKWGDDGTQKPEFPR